MSIGFDVVDRDDGLAVDLSQDRLGAAIPHQHETTFAAANHGIVAVERGTPDPHPVGQEYFDRTA